MYSTPKRMPEFLAGGGEMGERIRNFNWAETPLGLPETWEQSLKTCVRIMLTSSQPMWIGWGNQLIKLYNDPYKAIAGGKHPKALGQPAAVVWSDIWKDIEPLLKRVMEKDEGTYVESQLLLMDRNNYTEETYYTFSYTPIPGDKGGTAGMICANTDDTARIVNERALQTLRDLGKISFKGNITEIYTRALEVIAQNNKDFPSAFIYEVDETSMVAKAIAWVGDKRNYEVFAQEIDIRNPVEGTFNICKAITTSQIVLSENEGKRMDAPKGYWPVPSKQFLHIPLKFSNKKYAGAILTVGLNPYRKFDNAYQQFTQLLSDQLSLDLNSLFALEQERKRAEALAEIDKAKTVFFNNISHEFRTPLTLILGPLEELMQQPTGKISLRNLASIQTTHRNAMRLLKLVNTLLDFSRIESGRQQANFSLVNIASLTKDLCANFRSVCEKAGLKLTIETKQIPDPVYVDTQMWEKIVFNLLSNAFKYTHEGSINVQLFGADRQVILKVTDTGVGIPEKELPHMFERFHRVQGSPGRTYEGTGIGLSMIKELTNLHGGSIQVKSTEGFGSSFTVTIPTGKAHLQPQQIIGTGSALVWDDAGMYVEEAASLLGHLATDNSKEQEVPAIKAGENAATILVVDDNADMRDHIKNLLGKQYNILTAGNGEQALKIIKSTIPNLVVSDIMMPVMDGIELLKVLKQNNSTARIPVILLSARAGEEARIEGYDLGADDYIVKPFSGKELFARIKVQLNLSAARSHADKQIRNLFLQAPVAICIFRGPEYIIDLANENMLELWGKKAGQVLHKPMAEALPEISGQGFDNILSNVYTTGKPFIAPEIPVNLFRNGKIENIFIKLVYEPLYETDGSISGIMTLADEITEQVRARKQIEESEEQLRIAIEGGELGTFDFDPDKKTLKWSAKTKEFFGLPPDAEVDYNTYLQALHPEYRLGSQAVAESSKANGTDDLYELEYKTIGITDGKIRWIRSKGKITFDDARKPIRFTGVTQDITQRKQWEQGLKESEERFRTLAETLPQLIWQTDEKGIAEFASARWKQYTGIEPVDEVSWAAVVHPDDLEKISSAWKHSLENGNVYKLNVRLKSKGGTYRWFSVYGEPVINSEKKIIKWVGSFTDIHTEIAFSQELEKQVESRTSELAKSKRSLEEKNLQLEKVNKELESFAYVSSHDLQEPLRKIQIFITRLIEKENENLSETGKDYFKRIQNAAERMQLLIQDLLAFSRISNEKMQFFPVDLIEIVREVKMVFKETIEEKQAIIESDSFCTIPIIPFQFKQLLQNLIGNALKFSKKSVPPHIVIRSEMITGDTIGSEKFSIERKYCHISVADNGIGFDPHFKEQIFEVFQRLHGKDEYVGTGIGLAIVKKIVDNHKGFITATSTINEGATFDIYIPADL